MGTRCYVLFSCGYGMVFLKDSCELFTHILMACFIDTSPIGKISSVPRKQFRAWWRHQMETVSALLVICAGNSPVNGEFPTQRPVTRSFDVFFDLRLNKRLSKQSWSWWFETPSRPLYRHCYGYGQSKYLSNHSEPQKEQTYCTYF